MKKLLICVLFSIILLGGAFMVDAKENFVKKTNRITKEIVGGRTCDVNKNNKTDIDDITQIIDDCLLRRGSEKKCDLNKDGKFNIEDVTYFYDVCYYEILNQPKTNNQIKKVKIQQNSKIVNVKVNK